MKNIFKLFLISTTCLYIFACAKPIEVERSADFYQMQGDDYFADKKYTAALTAYENALTRAESPELASKIQLAMADCYYFAEEYKDAIPVYQVYLDVYSSSKEAPLANLRIGLSYYELRLGVLKDQNYIIKANEYLHKAAELDSSFVTKYDLNKIFKDIHETLALKDFKIGAYYARILQYEPALLRFKSVVDNYSDTEIYPEAAYRLIKLLVKDKKIDEAETYFTALSLKAEGDSYVKDARKIIDEAFNK